jgi:hypothetical protein
MLDDPKSSPYMKLIDIDPEFGVANSTGQGKSMAIKRMFGIGRLEPDWTLPSRLGLKQANAVGLFCGPRLGGVRQTESPAAAVRSRLFRLSLLHE